MDEAAGGLVEEAQDVARALAAFGAPALRYRSFRRGPVVAAAAERERPARSLAEVFAFLAARP